MNTYEKFNYDKHSKLIETLSFINQKNFNEKITTKNISNFWMVTPDIEAKKPNIVSFSRRIHDVLAASYCGYIAFLQDNGHDCINHKGHLLELKLTQANSNNFTIGKNNKLKYKKDSSWISSVGANYDISLSTDLKRKSQDTALILWSEDHSCFISGFIMKKDHVYDFLTERDLNCKAGSRVKRNISLYKFLTYGHEFPSPHATYISFELYENALYNYVMAREGYFDNFKTNYWINFWKNLPEISKNIKKSLDNSL